MQSKNLQINGDEAFWGVMKVCQCLRLWLQPPLIYNPGTCINGVQKGTFKLGFCLKRGKRRLESTVNCQPCITHELWFGERANQAWQEGSLQQSLSFTWNTALLMSENMIHFTKAWHTHTKKVHQAKYIARNNKLCTKSKVVHYELGIGKKKKIRRKLLADRMDYQ